MDSISIIVVYPHTKEVYFFLKDVKYKTLSAYKILKM